MFSFGRNISALINDGFEIFFTKSISEKSHYLEIGDVIIIPHRRLRCKTRRSSRGGCGSRK